jgi:hypothetical protein
MFVIVIMNDNRRRLGGPERKRNIPVSARNQPQISNL